MNHFLMIFPDNIVKWLATQKKTSRNDGGEFFIFNTCITLAVNCGVDDVLTGGR